jgi:hypothetical protein
MYSFLKVLLEWLLPSLTVCLLDLYACVMGAAKVDRPCFQTSLLPTP